MAMRIKTDNIQRTPNDQPQCYFGIPIGLVIEIGTELYSIHSYLIVYITLTDTTPQHFVPVPSQELDF